VSTFHTRVKYISRRTIRHFAHSKLDWVRTHRQTHKSENSISAKFHSVHGGYKKEIKKKQKHNIGYRSFVRQPSAWADLRGAKGAMPPPKIPKVALCLPCIKSSWTQPHNVVSVTFHYIRQVNAVNGGDIVMLDSICPSFCHQSINRLQRHRCTRRR